MKPTFRFITVAQPNAPWDYVLQAIYKGDKLICGKEDIEISQDHDLAVERITIPNEISKQIVGHHVIFEHYADTMDAPIYRTKGKVVALLKDDYFGIQTTPRPLYPILNKLFKVNLISFNNYRKWKAICFAKIDSVPFGEDAFSKEPNHKVFGIHWEVNFASRKKDPNNKIFWKPRLKVIKGELWDLCFLGFRIGFIYSIRGFLTVNLAFRELNQKAKKKKGESNE